MAEPIGLASGLLTLTSFAFQSSITLYQTVQSFRNHPKRVRDLYEELEALSEVLGLLTETVNATTEIDLSALDLPLLRCGHACNGFEQEIIKCSSRSGSSRTSFRDWAKLSRKSNVTAENLEGYKDLIRNTTDDLQAHLQNIDEKLDTIFRRTVSESVSDTAELRLIKEERMSAQKCLQICAQLSDHIDQIQLPPNRSSSSPGPMNPDTSPENLTTESLQECKNSLILTTAKLERFMKDRIDRLVAKSKTTLTSEEDAADLIRLQEEWETARQCVKICSKADTHFKENISIIDNYATGDAVQFMVSTDGEIIHGKNRGLGWRSRQVGGYLSDASVQQLSRDMSSISFHNIGSEGTHPRGGTRSIPDDKVENQPGSEFKERYGRGFKLTERTNVDTPMSSAPPADGRPSSSPKD